VPEALEGAPEVLETAPEILEATPEIIEAAPEAVEGGTALAEGAGIGVGAVGVAILAGLAVLFWPSDTIVSGDDERRMNEAARRQQPQPQAQPQTESRPREEEKQTCASRFPTFPLCDALPAWYSYSSAQAALRALKTRLGKKDLSLHSEAPATSGPCKDVGKHYNVRSGGARAASIVCCPCCTDAPAGPVATTRCGIV
jgi:hypothetical protein